MFRENAPQKKEKLSILFVTSDKYPPFRPAAKAIYSEVLSQRGHRIDWLLQADERRDDTTRSWRTMRVLDLGGGKAYVCGTNDGVSRLSRLVKHLKDLCNDIRMFSLVRRNRYDLIQVKDKYLAAIIAILAAKWHDIRFFYWIAFPHGEASIYEAEQKIARYPMLYRMRGKFLKLLLYKIILPAADHVFVQSEQMKKDFTLEGISPEKMTPIPSSVSLADMPYEPQRVRSVDVQNEYRIIYLGTLNRMRGLDFIIRVFQKVHKRIPNSRLVLIGKGDSPSDEELLHQEVNACGLESAVDFLGHLPMCDAWDHVKSADVCLSPYLPTPILRSTSPTKLVEYMAMGRPVVANDHPEQKLVLKQSGAGVTVAWEENAFANAVVSLLQKPDVRQSMGENGRNYIENYRTNEKLADTVERQYMHFFSNCTVH